MLSHVPGLQTYNSKQPFSLVNGVAVQIYRQASKLTTSPGSLRLHIEITCDYITLQIYMKHKPPSRICSSPYPRRRKSHRRAEYHAASQPSADTSRSLFGSWRICGEPSRLHPRRRPKTHRKSLSTHPDPHNTNSA